MTYEQEELERILKYEGIQKLSLTTDKYDNEATLAFYQKTRLPQVI